MNHTDRKFGIEIEFVGVERTAVESALRAAGIDARVERYNHITSENWKIVTDASLHHRSGLTGEIVSPILQGDHGFAQLQTVCTVLNDLAGCTVNRTCGLHVHLDCRDMTVPEISKVWERYANYEQQIDLIMPISRRGESRWCRGISNHADRMKQFETKSDQAHAMNRYHKVNLTNIATRGAMEFRQHSGTTEFRKIGNWVCYLMQFVETSIALTVEASSAPVTKRAFNEIRNLFENNDMNITWKRGSNKWVIRKVSTNRLLGTITTEELRELYITRKKSHLHSTHDTAAFIRPLTAVTLIESRTGESLTPNWRNAVCTDAVIDLGWMHGVEQSVQDYFEERYEELN